MTSHKGVPKVSTFSVPRKVLQAMLCVALLTMGIIVLVVANESRNPALARNLGGLQIFLSIALFGIFMSQKPNAKKRKKSAKKVRG